MLIQTSAVGLVDTELKVYVASARNNWCQGNHKFLQTQSLWSDAAKKTLNIQGEVANLQDGDEFKLIVPNAGADNAARIYAARMDAAIDTIGGVHVDRRFDYDPNTGHFWLLANNQPIVRQGHWNQNNIYTPTT